MGHEFFDNNSIVSLVSSMKQGLTKLLSFWYNKNKSEAYDFVFRNNSLFEISLYRLWASFSEPLIPAINTKSSDHMIPKDTILTFLDKDSM